MRKRRPLMLLLFVLSATASAQRRWANAAGYDLFQQAIREADPARKIEVLLEWEAAYPNSEYHMDGTAILMNAYKSAGRPAEAFARATQLFKLDSRDIGASSMIAALAPSLQAPSHAQITVTEEAANNLLSRAAEVGRTSTAPRQAATDTIPQEPADPETERVGALLREWRQDWRRTKHNPTAAEVESEIRKVAEKALAWAKSAQ
jgi:hypothetical protein